MGNGGCRTSHLCGAHVKACVTLISQSDGIRQEGTGNFACIDVRDVSSDNVELSKRTLQIDSLCNLSLSECNLVVAEEGISCIRAGNLSCKHFHILETCGVVVEVGTVSSRTVSPEQKVIGLSLDEFEVESGLKCTCRHGIYFAHIAIAASVNFTDISVYVCGCSVTVSYGL